VAIHVWATGISLKNPRFVQNKLGAVIEIVRHSLFSRVISRQQYSKSDVTPFFRANGYPPDTREYKDLLENNFVNWRLKVHGLVEKPFELSLADLHAMKKERMDCHSRMGGVPMSYIISLCRPLSQARYVVFYSYQYSEGAQFYEAIYMELAKHHQTILAYEMNGEPLSVPHGVPPPAILDSSAFVITVLNVDFVSLSLSLLLVGDTRNAIPQQRQNMPSLQ